MSVFLGARHAAAAEKCVCPFDLASSDPHSLHVSPLLSYSLDRSSESRDLCSWQSRDPSEERPSREIFFGRERISPTRAKDPPIVHTEMASQNFKNLFLYHFDEEIVKRRGFTLSASVLGVLTRRRRLRRQYGIC